VDKAREAAKQCEEGWSSQGYGSDGGEGVKPAHSGTKGNTKLPPAKASSGTQASHSKTTKSDWSANYRNTNVQSTWGATSHGNAGGWGNGGGTAAKNVGGLAKGIADMGLSEKGNGSGSKTNNNGWKAKSAPSKPAKPSKPSKKDDWGMGNGGNTYGW